MTTTTFVPEYTGVRVRDRPVRVRGRRLSDLAAESTAYFRQRGALLLLSTAAITLTYGCGAFFFWFHSVYRGEEGPALSAVHHWLLDSTLGFVALAPTLLLILPAAAGLVKRVGRLSDLAFAAAVGGAFAAVTSPGPFAHALLAGPGTPLANAATAVLGTDTSVLASQDGASPSLLAECAYQFVLGVPVYTLGALAALVLTRAAIRLLRL